MKQSISSAIISVLVCAVMLTGYHTFFRKKSIAANLNASSSAALPTSFAAYHGEMDGLPNDFTLSANRAMPSVVHIKSTQTVQAYDPWGDFFGWGGGRSRSAESSGSGVIMNEDGYIVTNNHVIKDAEQIMVTLYDNRSFPAEVIGTDPSTDLGVIRIKAEHLSPIELSNSDETKVGQWVIAVGNPFNLASTVTAGIVSAIGRNLEIIKDQAALESFIQTDAAVNPGNSGGALVDLQGRLVGVNTAISSPTGAYAGYAFAIPANIVKKIVADLIEYGTVQRVYLGFGKSTVLNNVEAEKYELPIQEGIFLQSLNPNGSAAKAGLMPGDVITKIDGKAIKTEANLSEVIARKRPGDKITITIFREGENEDIEVLLKNQQGTTAITRRSPKLQEFGMDLAELDARTRKQYSITHGVQVTRLYAGKLRQFTDMQQGFVILEVNKEKVTTPEDVTDILEKAKGKITIEGFIPNFYVNGRLFTGSYTVDM